MRLNRRFHPEPIFSAVEDCEHSVRIVTCKLFKEIEQRLGIGVCYLA